MSNKRILFAYYLEWLEKMLEILPVEYLRAILLLGITTIVWIATKFHHKYADRSLEWLEGIVEGYAINAFFWSGMIGLSVIAIHYHIGWVLHLMLLILFTKVFGVVTFIEISSTLISIFWGVEKQSNGKLDYRAHIATFFGVVAIILVIFYLTNNLPPNPASFP